MVWEDMLFEEFQDGHHGGQLGYRNGTILAILNLLCRSDASCQVSAQWDFRFSRRCLLKKFKIAGGHLGYQNGMILAILNLYVTPMPPMKFQLNLTYGFGGDVI